MRTTMVGLALLLLPLAAPAGAATDCFSTHTTGSGASLLKVCFSRGGNLVLFESPAAAEHVRVTPVIEGWAICSAGGVHGWDAAESEAGLGAPTVSQPSGPNTFPLTVTRTTVDGIFRVEQTFTWNIAGREVKVAIKVTNLSATARAGVRVSRYVDADVCGDAGDDRWARTADSVWAWEDGPSAQGLELVWLTPGFPHETAVEAAATFVPGGCDAAAPSATPTPPTDAVGRLTYTIGTLAPGASASASVIYRRL